MSGQASVDRKLKPILFLAAFDAGSSTPTITLSGVGAGMSGGIAYAYDPHRTFKKRCNKEGLNLDLLSQDSEVEELKQLIENHYNATLSPLAQRILEQWETAQKQFVRVFPEEYKQALIRLEKENFVKK